MNEDNINQEGQVPEEIKDINIDLLRLVPFQVVKVPDMDQVAVTLSVGKPLPQDYTEEDIGRLKVEIIRELSTLVNQIIKSN